MGRLKWSPARVCYCCSGKHRATALTAQNKPGLHRKWLRRRKFTREFSLDFRRVILKAGNCGHQEKKGCKSKSFNGKAGESLRNQKSDASGYGKTRLVLWEKKRRKSFGPKRIIFHNRVKVTSTRLTQLSYSSCWSELQSLTLAFPIESLNFEADKEHRKTSCSRQSMVGGFIDIILCVKSIKLKPIWEEQERQLRQQIYNQKPAFYIITKIETTALKEKEREIGIEKATTEPTKRELNYLCYRDYHKSNDINTKQDHYDCDHKENKSDTLEKSSEKGEEADLERGEMLRTGNFERDTKRHERKMFSKFAARRQSGMRANSSSVLVCTLLNKKRGRIIRLRRIERRRKKRRRRGAMRGVIKKLAPKRMIMMVINQRQARVNQCKPFWWCHRNRRQVKTLLKNLLHLNLTTIVETVASRSKLATIGRHQRACDIQLVTLLLLMLLVGQFLITALLSASIVSYILFGLCVIRDGIGKNTVASGCMIIQAELLRKSLHVLSELSLNYYGQNEKQKTSHWCKIQLKLSTRLQIQIQLQLQLEVKVETEGLSSDTLGTFLRSENKATPFTCDQFNFSFPATERFQIKGDIVNDKRFVHYFSVFHLAARKQLSNYSLTGLTGGFVRHIKVAKLVEIRKSKFDNGQHNGVARRLTIPLDDNTTILSPHSYKTFQEVGHHKLVNSLWKPEIPTQNTLNSASLKLITPVHSNFTLWTSIERERKESSLTGGLEHFSSANYSIQSLFFSPITFKSGWWDEKKLVEEYKKKGEDDRRDVNSTWHSPISLIIHSGHNEFITSHRIRSIRSIADGDNEAQPIPPLSNPRSPLYLYPNLELIDRCGLEQMLLLLDEGRKRGKLLERFVDLLVMFELKSNVSLGRTGFVSRGRAELLLPSVMLDGLTLRKPILGFGDIATLYSNKLHLHLDILLLLTLLNVIPPSFLIQIANLNESAMRSHDHICIDCLPATTIVGGNQNKELEEEETISKDRDRKEGSLKVRNIGTFNGKVIVGNESKAGYLSCLFVAVDGGSSFTIAGQASLAAVESGEGDDKDEDLAKMRVGLQVVAVAVEGGALMLPYPEVTTVRVLATKLQTLAMNVGNIMQNSQCLANLRVLVVTRVASLDRSSGNITMKAHYLCFRRCHYGCCCCCWRCYCYYQSSKLFFHGASDKDSRCTAKRRRQQQGVEQTLPFTTLENQSASSSVATQSKLITKEGTFWFLSNVRRGGFYRMRKGSRQEWAVIAATATAMAALNSCEDEFEQRQLEDSDSYGWKVGPDQERPTCKPRPLTVLSSDCCCTNCFARGRNAAGVMTGLKSRTMQTRQKKEEMEEMEKGEEVGLEVEVEVEEEDGDGRQQVYDLKHHMKYSNATNSTSKSGSISKSKFSLEWFMTLFAVLLLPLCSALCNSLGVRTQVVAMASGISESRGTTMTTTANPVTGELAWQERREEKMQRHSGRSIIGEFLPKLAPSSIKPSLHAVTFKQVASSRQVGGFDQLGDSNSNNNNKRKMFSSSKWNLKRGFPEDESRDKPELVKWWLLSNGDLSEEERKREGEREREEEKEKEKEGKRERQEIAQEPRQQRQKQKHVVGRSKRASRELNDNDDDSDDNNDNGRASNIGGMRLQLYLVDQKTGASSPLTSSQDTQQQFENGEHSAWPLFDRELPILEEEEEFAEQQRERSQRQQHEALLEDKINIFSTKVTKEAPSRAPASLSPVQTDSWSFSSSISSHKPSILNKQSDKSDLEPELKLKQPFLDSDMLPTTSAIGSLKLPLRLLVAPPTAEPVSSKAAHRRDSGHEKDSRGGSKDRLTSRESSIAFEQGNVLIGSQQLQQNEGNRKQFRKRESEFVPNQTTKSSSHHSPDNNSGRSNLLRLTNQQQQQRLSSHHRSSLILNELSKQQQRRPTITTAPTSSQFPFKSINGQCNEKCLCVWKNGKQFADCSNSKFASIPTSLDPLLQVLNFSFNYLTELPNSAFVSLNLNNLQRIYMSNCHMEKVEPKAFENLKLVVELDFSWNKLKFVPLPQMRQLSLLRRLTMRGNPLFSLDEFTMSGGISNLTQVSSKSKGSNSEREGVEKLGGGIGIQRAAGSDEDGAGLEANNVTLEKNLARFYESYPKLARTLVRFRLRSESNSFSVENSVIIKSSKNYSKSSNRAGSGSGSGTGTGNGGFGLNYLSDKVSHEFLEQSLFDDSREFEILRALIERDFADDYDSASPTTKSLFDKIVPGNNDEGTDEEEEQLEVSPGNEHELDNNVEEGVYSEQQQLKKVKQTFGTYFSQLQELDFGQCKLSYIKWTSLSHLKQLKRLLLDGNHLSQLSGRLIEALPGGLHQLSLEENPWKCDCRLLELKHWLLTTRTPLRAPVRCQSTSLMSLPIVAPKLVPTNTMIGTQSSNFKPFGASIKGDQAHLIAIPNNKNFQYPVKLDREPQLLLSSSSAPSIDEANSFQQHLRSGENSFIKPPSLSLSSSSPKGLVDDIMSSKLQHNSHFFDQLMVEDFVCAPKALNIAGQQPLALVKQPLGNNLSIKSSSSNLPLNQQQQQMSPEKLQEITRSTNLREIYEYLEPTLIQVPPKGSLGNQTQHMVRDSVNYDEENYDEATTFDQSVANKINNPINANLKLANEPSNSQTLPSAYNSRSSQAWSTSTPTVHLNSTTLRNEASFSSSNVLKVQPKEIVQANEDESITLRCAFFALPESSVDIIWLADYNHHPDSPQQHQQSSLYRPANLQFKPPPQALSGRLPAEERFVVLYDSKLHRQNGSNNSINSSQDQSNFGLSNDEVNLYNSRIVVSETHARPASSDDSLFVYKESLFTIQSVLLDDSARYKCIALNKAGNASFEYLLRVSGSQARGQFSSAASSMLTANSGSNGMSRDTTHLNNGNNNQVKTASPGFQHHLRDQRAQQNKQEIELQASRRKDLNGSNLAAQSSNQQTTQTHLVPSNTWLKSSTTFQVTIVVVSFLMAAVIIAFLLICIVIYQIKPSSTQTILLANGPPSGGSIGGLFSSMVSVGRQKFGVSGDAISNSIAGQTRSYLIHNQQPQQQALLFSRDDNNNNQAAMDNLIMNETPFFMTNVHQPVPVLATVTNSINGTSPIHLLATDHNQNGPTQIYKQQQIQANNILRASPMQTIDPISRFSPVSQNHPQAHQIQSSSINSPVSSDLSHVANSIQQIDQLQNQHHFAN